MKVNNWDKEILRLAIPSIITNVTVPLLGLVDLAIVGHIGNETMIGAIAVGSMVFNVMYWLMGFLRMGTTGMTAQSMAQQSTTGKSSVLFTYLRLALLIALAMLVLQVPLRWLALWLMGPSEEVVALVHTYYNICIWGAPAMLSLYVMTGWFVGMQDTRTPMVVSITQNVINIIASLVLVFGFKMQIEGVALGTLIAQWSGAAMAWQNLPRPLRRRGKPRGLKFYIKQIVNRKTLPSFGGGGGGFTFFQVNRNLFLRTLCLVAVNLFFTSAGARQGDLLLSVNTLLMTFFTLFSYVMDGFANAGEALSGKFYGAGNGAEFHAVNKRLFVWGWLMVVLFTLVYVVGGRGFLGLLTSEERVVDAAMTYLPWALLIPVSGMAAFVYDGIFIGMMETKGMLVSCAIATATFFIIHFSLFHLWGNHALWLALIAYLALRGIIQYWWMGKKCKGLKGYEGE